jgi:hypothetical protein
MDHAPIQDTTPHAARRKIKQNGSVTRRFVTGPSKSGGGDSLSAAPIARSNGLKASSGTSMKSNYIVFCINNQMTFVVYIRSIFYSCYVCKMIIVEKEDWHFSVERDFPT